MDTWQAITLGVVEGITEYLPVSSTGHLLLTQSIMGIGKEGEQAKAAADAFAVVIQGGAILAVLGLYWKRVLQMIRGVLGQDPEGLRLAIAIIAGFMPAAIIGKLLNHWIKGHLFNNMWPVVTAWLVGGVAILATAMWRKRNPPRSGGVDLPHLTWQLALIIGLLQCVAMCPGTSRSLMTICGGMIVGLSLSAAVEFSFLLGVVTLTAATVYEAGGKVRDFGPDYDKWFGGTHLMIHEYGVTPMLIGIVAAAVSAALAVKWLVTYLSKHGLHIFGWYRIALGITVCTLIYMKVID